MTTATDRFSPELITALGSIIPSKDLRAAKSDLIAGETYTGEDTITIRWSLSKGEDTSKTPAIPWRDIAEAALAILSKPERGVIFDRVAAGRRPHPNVLGAIDRMAKDLQTNLPREDVSGRTTAIVEIL